MSNLKKTLLSYGGKTVCFPGYEPDLKNIISRGKLMRNKVILRLGIQSQCHYNSARLYNQYKTYSLVTGYALSDDGIWRQHSWCLNGKNNIIETTEKRIKYFGFIMNKEESETFVYEND